ncbi:hypothetical protein ACP275_12G056100 [Erythranthe tilingii]
MLHELYLLLLLFCLLTFVFFFTRFYSLAISLSCASEQYMYRRHLSRMALFQLLSKPKIQMFETSADQYIFQISNLSLTTLCHHHGLNHEEHLDIHGGDYGDDAAEDPALANTLSSGLEHN